MRGIKPALLSVAGYDPTAGAGLLLDVAVFRRFGFPGLGIVTALTVQNTARVQSFSCLRPPSVWSQYQALARDISIGGIKIGMLGSEANIAAAARILKAAGRVPSVLDPIFRASSGKRLLARRAVPGLIARLKGAVTVVTPNLGEARLLSGKKADSLVRMEEAAREISVAMDAAVVVKGGHLSGPAVNVLYDGRGFYLFEKERLRRDVHGTGCFFSSALLCRLVLGDSLVEAVRASTDLTHDAIRQAVRLGKGRLVISPAAPASSG
jgi:hydroxymethylpyrimidine kinase/phosphomethylpyrimidine kinase